MKHRIIVPTGYMGSGSSAVTDLLSELDRFDAPNGAYEYVFMHCPNGIFDLEDKLLQGNNALRSDEALHAFRCEMQSLYSLKNYWVGSYNKFISRDFLVYVDAFLNEIRTDCFVDTYWYYMQKPVDWKMQATHYLRRILKVIFKDSINLKSPLQYPSMSIAFPTEAEFYLAARRFIDHIFNDLGRKEKNLIIDQLLLPHNLYRIDNYFGEELRVIVVERDPRDVFILNKYLWAEKNNAVPYPLNAKRFSLFYKRMRQTEKIKESKQILRIHFEDLVYNYDQTVAKIISFVDSDLKKHVKKKERFDPATSIKNTQLFLMNKEYEMEAAVIAEELPEYLYSFPKEQIVRKGIQSLF